MADAPLFSITEADRAITVTVTRDITIPRELLSNAPEMDARTISQMILHAVLGDINQAGTSQIETYLREHK